MRFRLVPKSLTLDDIEWPWTAKTHSVAEKMRLLEPTAQIWMKIDPYYQRQKCRPMNLVSRHIRFMAGVPLSGGVKWEWGWRRRHFLAIWVATSSESSEIRPAYYMATCYPLSAGNWLQNEWPWMTLNGQNALCCRKYASFGAHSINLNDDRPILSATKM